MYTDNLHKPLNPQQHSNLDYLVLFKQCIYDPSAVHLLMVSQPAIFNSGPTTSVISNSSAILHYVQPTISTSPHQVPFLYRV